MLNDGNDALAELGRVKGLLWQRELLLENTDAPVSSELYTQLSEWVENWKDPRICGRGQLWCAWRDLFSRVEEVVVARGLVDRLQFARFLGSSCIEKYVGLL